jgi:SAM-dependent methyltransferase
MTMVSKFLSWGKPPLTVVSDVPPATELPANEQPDPWTGLKDAVMRGWFNQHTGELYTGFPVGPEDVVVDIGCGDGGNARFCATRGAKLILADIDPACIANASAKLAEVPDHKPFECYVTDSDPLPIADGVATRVVCTEVIEHVDSPAGLLAEMARIGRSGARYLITCPDPGAEAIQQRLAPPAYFARPNHLRIVAREELISWVEAAGLVVEARSSHGFYWSMWWTLFWACDVSFENPRHKVLDHWALCWDALLKQPEGEKIKHALDDLMPKSQIVIARKP